MGRNSARSIGNGCGRRRRLALMAGAAVAVVATSLPGAAAPPAASTGGWREVVVTGSGAEEAARVVGSAGGQVTAFLPLVQGVAARLPSHARLGPAWAVAPQRELRLAATPAVADDGPATTLRGTLGLTEADGDGAGVTVAVVDTGIADVPDLAGRVSHRVDLTGTGDGDGYGHGTFMAGLIAGSGAASGGRYRGVAPAARLADVKVADAEGATDLITVLRGLQWVSEHAREVRVLNLSLSSDSPLPYQIDPLTQALEGLWRRGVTVVVPSGNDGPDAGTVTSPGSDPVLLTVGGVDESGTTERSDDVVGGWSGRGPTWQGVAKPDVAAPGGHLVSLRSPGSVVDTASPQSRVGTAYFRGSGTSMATAVTSGVVAATLGVEPRLRPDEVKSLLVASAYPAAGLTRAAGAGSGGVDARRILDAAPSWRTSPVAERYRQDTDAIVRDAKRWAALEHLVLAGDGAAATAAWDKLSPASRDWAARAWADLDPAARAWAARAWAARAWAGADGEWAARAWAARAWAARAWADAEWSARAWADATWSARAWAELDWTARSWATNRWSARSWAWLPPQ